MSPIGLCAKVPTKGFELPRKDKVWVRRSLQSCDSKSKSAICTDLVTSAHLWKTICSQVFLQVDNAVWWQLQNMTAQTIHFAGQDDPVAGCHWDPWQTPVFIASVKACQWLNPLQNHRKCATPTQLKFHHQMTSPHQSSSKNPSSVTPSSVLASVDFFYFFLACEFSQLPQFCTSKLFSLSSTQGAESILAQQRETNCSYKSKCNSKKSQNLLDDKLGNHQEAINCNYLTIRRFKRHRQKRQRIHRQSRRSFLRKSQIGSACLNQLTSPVSYVHRPAETWKQKTKIWIQDKGDEEIRHCNAGEA